MRTKWTILLANTYDGSTNGSLRLTAYLHAKKKKKKKTQTDRNNHDNVIETVKWLSHESVVRPALVKLQLVWAWWFKAPVVFSPWQAAHLSCHLKSEPDAVICAVPVIIQTTRQWMWLYKNSPGGSLGIYTYESTTEYIISANINSTSNDMSQWLGHCCFVLFFI